MNQLSDKTLLHLRAVADLPDLNNTKYRLIEKIGSGGMGTVYKVFDESLKRQAALKVLNASLDPEKLSARMMREAEVMARLEHPGIVPIHDVGVLPDGRAFYVMKLVEGKRLDDVVRSSESLPDLLRLFQKVCEAVAFAHTRGVLHRDLKPENIMVGSFGEVLVMDWGVAKIMEMKNDDVQQSVPSDHSSTGTSAGALIGTPAYMAPEQFSGTLIQPNIKTDIYSLGAILYFILTKKAPDRAGSFVKPRDFVRDIPRPLEAISLRALAISHAERYDSALDIADDITRFLDNNSVSAYRENIFEKINRFLSKNWFIVWLVLAYLVMRALVFFFFGR